jgi:hypothetical protein
LAVLLLTIALATLGQVSRQARISKGPRALGLLGLMPNGKARLIPIMILYDGKFYDASAYKASPVPMALWTETAYEAVRSGVSQGLFSVTGALQNQQTHEWIAEGTWQTAESLAARSAKKPASSEPRGLNQDEGPPVLRHSGAAKPKPPEPAPAPATPPVPTTPPPAQPAASPSTPPAPATAASSTPSAPSPEPEDPNRPALKRGKPALAPAEPLVPPAPITPKSVPHTAASPSASAKADQIQWMPAISDAGGPEFQPYTYDVKPDEEQQLRKKMLALAGEEVRARVKQVASEQIGATEEKRSAKPRTPAKPVQPSFEDVQLRLFDLSNSNEPTLVLIASARMPQRPNEEAANLQYFVTVVARVDINGDFHKAFSNVTDTQHLDVTPKFELIDAVDADGDGRAELLFRKVSDAGSAFVVYRVIGDQLYALFEGTPGE